MERIPQRLSFSWSRLPDWRRRHVSVLVLIGLGYLVHYLVFCIPQPFIIEDAAITFTYARHLVEGEGLVVFPGGEPVEGYSNALWMFLMAAVYALGVPMWGGSKIVGAVFGLATLPLVYLLVLRALPPARHEEGPPRHADVALLAPLLLAFSTQFVVWNASGLENSLFCLLLVGGVWRLLVETSGADAASDRPGQRDRFPVSALLFFGLTATRPEGPMYAAIALAARALFAVQARRWRGLVGWLAVLVVPWLLYNGWRYWYFAWPFPNTFYAKVGDQGQFKPFAWDAGGWRYIRNWFETHGTWLGIPLVVVGLVGLRSWRRWLSILIIAVLSVLLLWDGRAGISTLATAQWWRPVRGHWDEIRVWALLGSGVVAGVASFARPGWRARGLLWATCAASLFFIVYTGKDWMKAHRWFNLVVPTLLPLGAIGLGELLDHLVGRDGRLVAPYRLRDVGWIRAAEGFPLRRVLLLLVGGCWIASEAWHSNEFANGPETAVRDVYRRVIYMRDVQEQLDLDDVVLLDVDMGAHVYFSGWRIVDIAGLVDVPVARHRDYDKRFVAQYVFEEWKPDFAHVHSNWARTSKIPQHQEWKDGYLEIPGYPISGRRLHVGNHVRRDLFITDTRRSAAVVPATTRAVTFQGGVKLRDWAVPSPEVAAGGELFLDTRWSAGFRKDGFRILAVLDDGEHRAVTSLAPGYDWYKPEDWKLREIVAGRYRVPVPASLPEGTYDLGIVLLDEKSGETLGVTAIGETAGVEAVLVPELDEGAEGAEGDAVDEGAENEAAENEGAENEGAAEQGAADGGQAGEHRYLPGELWIRGAVTVVSPDRAVAAAEADLRAASDAAISGRCDEAWPLFKNATRHVLSDPDWRADHEPGVRRQIAGCFLARAAASSDPDETFDALVAARHWDHRHPDLRAAARPLALAMDADGQERAERGDWDGAYQRFRDALLLEPSLSWTRRRAEQARDHSLGIESENIHPVDAELGGEGDADAEPMVAPRPPGPSVAPRPLGGGPDKPPPPPIEGGPPARR